ncbi:hypothetical protein BDW66DRAFT_163215 [Aspergillus desertorum]
MPAGVQKPTRRYHKKSRTGCTQCRSRRIKCDETHPSCQNCQRASMAPTESRTSFDMLDLTLMHHYTTVTSELWQTEVPIMARSSLLLMHGLLATAALHMAFLYKSSPSTFMDRALYHHNLGLELSNAENSTFSAQNGKSPALFTFGLTLVIWSYASPTIPSAITTAADESDLDTILSSLELARGNKVLFEISGEIILSQPIGRFLKPLEELARPRAPPQPIQAALIETQASLAETPFWERVRKHKPAALLIFMHYAIILAYYELRAWWMQGWSERLVGAVHRVLAKQNKNRSDWGFCAGRVLDLVMKVKDGEY